MNQSSRAAQQLRTLEESDEDVGRRAHVLLAPPGQQEGLSADQLGWAGLSRVIQAGRQVVELRQVDVREPEQRAVAGCQVLSDAPVIGRFQGILRAEKGTKRYHLIHVRESRINLLAFHQCLTCKMARAHCILPVNRLRWTR